ncbi:MAG: Dimethyladenosine transferase [bacterium P3]|nr:MAG: Dimethyladenosine transferase [bacterium P3]KWW41066.1 MAG: Dimethyladenosine transferase [bacterium F083]
MSSTYKSSLVPSQRVRAKKHLGQHFLRSDEIAQRIVQSLSAPTACVLEIGPGMGVLTQYLMQRSELELCAIEIDTESVEYLHVHYPSLRVVSGDFLRLDLEHLFRSPFSIIGNFPYNISSQILFRLFDHRDRVPELVGMFQKEVAERVTASPGSKVYGILSVLLSAFYDMEYLFTVSEQMFDPPPKVKSAVIRLRRNAVARLDCDEASFVQVVKAGFNQRRKTLRNALRQLGRDFSQVPDSMLSKRAEQLSVAEFVSLTRHLVQT